MNKKVRGPGKAKVQTETIHNSRTLAEVIRAIRQHLQLTQAGLANRVNVTLPSIYRYESGKSLPNLTTLKTLYGLAEDLNFKDGVHVLGLELASRSNVSSITLSDKDTLKPSNAARHGAEVLAPLQSWISAIGLEMDSNAPRVDDDQLKSEAAAKVRELLSQARNCLQSDLLSVSLVLSRSAVELTIWLALPNKDQKNVDVTKGLSQLHLTNLIDDRMLGWGTRVLDICNKGIHSMTKVSRDDALDAVNFAHWFLRYVYILPSDLADFNRRRQLPKPNE
jgi:transcriptional regulator with XRE-family HTH domain